MKRRARVAIWTSDDRTWGFPLWLRTIPELNRRHDVVGLYLFEEALGKRRGIRIPLWYLNVFGPLTFAGMCAFAVRSRLLSASRRPRSWEQLAAHFGLTLSRGETPNSEEVVDWTKTHRIDVILIMVGQILNQAVLDAPTIGVINKHASLMPACRGVFPFVWAKLRGVPLGVTFHAVTRKIDEGPVLVQQRWSEADSDVSMTRFYIDVFARFPRMALEAVDRLVEGASVPSLELENSYGSYPTRRDIREFKRRGFRVLDASDFWYQPKGERE